MSAEILWEKLSNASISLNKYFHPDLSSHFIVATSKQFNVYNISTFSTCLRVHYHKCKFAMQQLPDDRKKKLWKLLIYIFLQGYVSPVSFLPLSGRRGMFEVQNSSLLALFLNASIDSH